MSKLPMHINLGEQKVMRWKLIMLSDENNIPVPAVSAASTDDAPKDDHSPPSAFTITTTTPTMVTAMASLGFTMYVNVQNLDKKRQAKKNKPRKKRIPGMVRLRECGNASMDLRIRCSVFRVCAGSN